MTAEFICPNCLKLGYIPTLIPEEQAVPVSKIEAKIKELRYSLENNLLVGQQEIFRDCRIRGQIVILQDLLPPKQEKEKEKPNED